MAKKKTSKKVTKKKVKKEEVEESKEPESTESIESDEIKEDNSSTKEIILETTEEKASEPEIEEPIKAEEPIKVEEKAETEEKVNSCDRPEGAPDVEDCMGEFESATHYIYKIRHEKVSKYDGKKKILIEKKPSKV